LVLLDQRALLSLQRYPPVAKRDSNALIRGVQNGCVEAVHGAGQSTAVAVMLVAGRVFGQSTADRV
jgi:hypothetical protein